MQIDFMKTIKATIISKRLSNCLYFITFDFHDYYNIHNNSNIDEVRVSEIAYNKLNISDIVLCPMTNEPEGLVYDYDYPLQKL